MSMDPVFVFGTLRHDGLRATVLGDAGGVRAVPAILSGARAHWVEGADYPMLVEDPEGRAEGLVLEGLSEVHRARLDYFEGGFGYDLVPVEVQTDDGPRRALRYLHDDAAAPAGPWSLEDWADHHAPLWVAAAEEAMAYFGEIDGATLAGRMPMIRMRAGSRLRAEQPGPATVRSARRAETDVAVKALRRPYADYFAVVEADLSFRQFNDRQSPVLTRAGFAGGDAVTVLPYDPVRDEVLLVEQFRMGPFARGDVMPWVLEPIAGRVDPGEAIETTARREALEEAGLTLGRLHFVNGHYPSPGAVTEFVYAYVAEADLSGQHGTVAGLDTEGEDIRSHVVSFDTLMSLVETGEAGAGPLVISAFWLALNRATLRGDA